MLVEYPLSPVTVIGGERSTHGKGQKCIQNFSQKTWGDKLEDLGIDGRTASLFILQK